MGSMRFNTGTFTFHRNSDQRTAGHQTFTMRFYHSSWTHSYQTSAVATATVKDIDAVADPGFLMRGSPTLGCANLLFGKSFDENCMKMKRITERRELPPPPPPTPGICQWPKRKVRIKHDTTRRIGNILFRQCFPRITRRGSYRFHHWVIPGFIEGGGHQESAPPWFNNTVLIFHAVF